MRVLFNKAIYQNEDNGYCIFRYSVVKNDEFYEGEERGFYKKEAVITAVGYYLPTITAVEYDMDGEWVVNEKYGEQFKVTSCAPVIQETENGILVYLTSGLLKGVGVKTAQAIFDAFGLDTIRVLDEEPELLLSIKGISEKKLKKIVDSHRSSRLMRELIAFLAPYNITIHKIAQIYQEFGNKALSIVHEDPYQLRCIDGFGFKTVDAIARNIKIAPNDSRRVMAAAEYVLMNARNDGHLYLEKRGYLAKIYGVLNEGYNEPVIEMKEIISVVAEMINDDVLVVGDSGIYLKSSYLAESLAAEHIVRIINGKGPNYFVEASDIEEVESALDICLADKQKKALMTCLFSNISIVTGGPGTGKTTTLKAILNAFQRHLEGDILLMAPTGKAARRMEESTGMPASTIHSALNIHSDDFEYDSSSTLDVSFVVVDEFSMVDMFLANKLFSMIGSGTKVLLVGDPDQLPSIGAGNVFRELINCGEIPVTVLDVVYRQAETSSIIANSFKINTGKNNLKFDSDFVLVEANEDLAASRIIIDEYVRQVREHGLDNVQVLSPFRTKNESGVNRLNEEIQRILNPAKAGKGEVILGKRVFREGDRVMQTKNKFKISNGDVGYITRIGDDEDGDLEVIVEFSGGRSVTYEREHLELLDLAYATTVHKSQGSEHKVVILAMLNCFFVMLKRNLLYTAVTRAKDRVVIVGQKDAVDLAIRKNDIDKRNTALGRRISGALMRCNG